MQLQFAPMDGICGSGPVTLELEDQWVELDLFEACPWYPPARTTQGSGGSFKDRKPTGEGHCCESWTAEQIH